MTPSVPRFAILLLVWLVALLAITELVGWLFSWPAVFGGWRVGPVALYWPGQFLTWRSLLAAGHRWIVDGATLVSGVCALALTVRAALDLRGNRARGFGAGRWATRTDVRRSGLLGGGTRRGLRTPLTALSRWHPDWKDRFEAFVASELGT